MPPTRPSNRAILLALLVAGIATGVLAVFPAGDDPASEAAVTVADGQADAPERIILISMDTLRADRLGTYRADRTYAPDRNTSPAIDRFAEDSIVFENAVTPAPWTLPAHVSLFTGMHFRTHRIRSQRQNMPEEFVILPEVFAAGGYRTAGFHGGEFLAAKYGFGQGFDTYRNSTEFHPDRKLHLAANFEDAAAWLRANGTDDAFVFIHGYDAHAPYGAPGNYTHFFDANYTGPVDEHWLHRDEPPFATTNDVRVINDTPAIRTGNRTIPIDDRDIEHVRAAYDSTVRYIDAQFDRFITDLKREGLYNDTMIVLVSDHGENLGDRVYEDDGKRYLSGHWYLWDHNIQVPFIVHLPGAEPRRIETPVSLIDVAPTLYDAGGLRPRGAAAAQSQGESLLPLIYGDDGGGSYTFASDASLEDTMIRGVDRKLIERVEAQDLLYRLRDGVEEAISPTASAGTYRDLLDRLQAWRRRTADSVADLTTPGHPVRDFIARIRSVWAEPETPLTPLLVEHGLSIGAAGFTVTDARTVQEDGREVERLAAVRGDDVRLRIRIVPNASSAFARGYIRNEQEELISLYADIPQPYTERPEAQDCPPQFEPYTRSLDSSTRNVTIIGLYADSGLSYGACSTAEAAYSATVAVGYCPRVGTAFTIEAFMDPERTEDPAIIPTCPG